MQARGVLNYRLKYCWLKLICSICRPNELEPEIKQKTGEGKLGASQKSGGHGGPPRLPLRIATACMWREQAKAKAHIYVIYVNFWKLIIAFPNGGQWASFSKVCPPGSNLQLRHWLETLFSINTKEIYEMIV